MNASLTIHQLSYSKCLNIPIVYFANIKVVFFFVSGHSKSKFFAFREFTCQFHTS